MDAINERKVFGQLVAASTQEGTPQVGGGAGMGVEPASLQVKGADRGTIEGNQQHERDYSDYATVP